MTVGRNIRALRRRQGLTLDELSALSGVHRDDLGSYERGEATPRSENVRKIAAALHAPIAAIREGVGWTEPEPAEGWETEGGEALLREGILENVKESYGEAAALTEEEIELLMASVKAAVPALIERMKDTRPESEITRALLEELNVSPAPAGEDGAGWELTDAQWARVEDLLPPEKAGRGRAFKSNRLMLDGILYWLRSGKPWTELPARYGRSRCVSDRLALWERTGVWRRVLERMLAEGIIKGEDIVVDMGQFAAGAANAGMER